MPTRANTQPAFGVYFPAPQSEIARPYAMLVLTLEGDQISAITWFGDSSVFPHFGLPRTLRRELRVIHPGARSGLNPCSAAAPAAPRTAA